MIKSRKRIIVTKASGDKVAFSEAKLRESMKRAGASVKQIEDIIAEIKAKLYQGISTKKIYRIAFNHLRKSSKPTAAKYNLKRAIMQLGPSGFPFEKFIAKILKSQSYQIKVGRKVKGKCVTHEIDIIAEKGEHLYMIECKYHNQPGNSSDVKTPLYIQARFKDVESAWLQLSNHASKFHQGWVVTNTRFTGDAIQYGLCAGLHLIGWNYPGSSSLRAQIDRLALYPITCLTTLTKSEKQLLLSKNVVLCQDLCQDNKLLKKLGLKTKRISIIMSEVTQMCEELRN
jgi:Holliday junction resolvase-like predicted endonuclease